MNSKKKIGSAVLAVVLLIVGFSAYLASMTNQTTLSGYIQSDAEKQIKSTYEKDINKLDEIYNKLTKENAR